MSEKVDFSSRLRDALERAGIQTRSPTRFALEFNLRYWGRPVTTQAVRKWIAGKAIPSQDKIVALAKWLSVSAEWLRFGDGSAGGGNPVSNEADLAYHKQDVALFRDFATLNDEHKQIVREIVLTLKRIERT
ncbi:MAG: helix-turn-helix domain-containing protein [Sulfuricella sp.]|nr:helix-turn-helix domain-containing protein [Sulfuricella sp.]